MSSHRMQWACRVFSIVFLLTAAAGVQSQTSAVSISAIFPNNAISPGAKFVIRGRGFVGRNAIWLAETNGPGGLIGIVESSEDTSISGSLDSFHLCHDNRPAQGLPCRAYTAVKPGPYFIYARNESGETNRVQVVVTRSPSPLTVKEPSGAQQWKIGTDHRISWSVPTSDKRYQFTLQSAKAWRETYSIAPGVTGKNSIMWVTGTRCGLGGCSVDLPPGDYYVVVEDPKSAIQAWSSEPITLVP
jgi:hypothetical protein